MKGRRQKLPFHRHGLANAIQDQIEIEFAHDGDVEMWRGHLFRSVAGLGRMIASSAHIHSSKDGASIGGEEWFSRIAVGARPARHLFGLFGPSIGRAGGGRTDGGKWRPAAGRSHLQSSQSGWRLY